MITVDIYKEAEKEDTHYPVVKVSPNGRVVLFTAENTGTFLGLFGMSDIYDPYAIGFHYDRWDESVFRPFKGKITIEVS